MPANRRLPQLRHHGPHRCRQDHDDRAYPVLHRQVPQDRRSPRRRRHHGLDGAGAGARHHDHVGCHDHLLERLRSGDKASTASTSSTPPATSTSPSKSSVRCACSTAPCVLDGNAGVEPQTETVWRQADKYNVPRIVFVNKMDKIGADFYNCVNDDQGPHRRQAVPIQLPIGRDKLEGHRRPRRPWKNGSGGRILGAKSWTSSDPGRPAEGRPTNGAPS
jgi:hypothetical protein